mmetsp:Transcript_2510/g.4560  ORF Transcript_2510/g.4560 Transcript_2510/m.4560 type:complete len:760 (-) Transcript_2510:174-2453(-)
MTDRIKMRGGGGSDIVDDDSKSLQNNERDADTAKGDIIGASQSQPDVSNTTDAITTSASKFWTQNKRITAASISLAALVLATAAVVGTAASNKTSLSNLGVGGEPPISASAREEPGSETMALPCKNWCHSLQHASTPWSTKCNWKNCKGCDSCKEEVKPFFMDVTLEVNHPSNNWDGDDLNHSFRPGLFHFSASFPDWDNDGFLDYFHSNHWKMDYAADFDFGMSRPGATDTLSGGGVRMFHSIGHDTFVDTDKEQMFHDCHGATFADMDGDGLLDLLISAGGGRGTWDWDSVQNDNLLFWGDKSQGDTLARLTGGREAARAAGVECANCRSRFMLVTDANRDGKLDVFPISDVRVDDFLTPTPLLLNNGNRTFSNHLEMQEYTRTILLTDADGDGHAQEYMVFRATCFRDPSFGEHPESHHEFCSTRPEKTTAIYKFDDEKNQMILISPTYHRSQSNQVYTPWNNVAVIDSISGDFDFDQKADQIVLFRDKIVFYYSSDRLAGQLPLYNEDLGQSGSSEMNVPCSKTAFAIRAADIDNDGKLELIIMCDTPGELFVLSLQNPKSWMIEDWPLGDLQRTTGWKPEPRDIELACDGREGREGYSDYWGKVCSKSSVPTPRMYGFQLIDLNNDGFLDAVLASGIGYQRFFLNNPEASKGNRFIRVELKSTVSNVHSIGTTLIFEASGLEPQLREITSFGYGNSRGGGVDDRIVFGLGQNAEPVSLTVRWPSMKETVISLTGLGLGHISNYSNPIIVTEDIA